MQAEKPICLRLNGLGRQGIRYLETVREMNNVFFYESNITGGVVGAVIATPPTSHIDLAITYLSEGLYVMIEKPVALSYEDASRIDGAKVLVNHTHLFAPAYERLKKLLVPPIVRIDISHHGPGPARDYSGLYDYGSHGVAMCLDLVGWELRIHPGPDKVVAQKVDSDLFDVQIKWHTDRPVRAFLHVGSGTTEKRCWMRVQTATQIFEYDGLLGQLHLNGVVQEMEDERTPLNKAIGVFVEYLRRCLYAHPATFFGGAAADV